MLVRARRPDDLDVTRLDDEEPRICRPRFDKDFAILTSSNVTVRGYALHLFRLQRREHPFGSRSNTCQLERRNFIGHGRLSRCLKVGHLFPCPPALREEAIDTQYTRPQRHDGNIDQHMHQGFAAAVTNGPRAARSRDQEVSREHFGRDDKRRWTGKQADDQQRSRDKVDVAGDPRKTVDCERRNIAASTDNGQDVEDLPCTVLHHEEADDCAHDGAGIRFKSSEPLFQRAERMRKTLRLEPAIETPCARTGSHDPQVEVAKQHRLFAAVRNRPEATRRPRLKIRDGHFTAQDEGSEARKQAECEERRADRFEKTGNAPLYKQAWYLSRSGKSEKLLRAVLKEQQRCHNADGENYVGRIGLPPAKKGIHLMANSRGFRIECKGDSCPHGPGAK